MDVGGVALAAIQALAKENRELREINQSLKGDVDELKATMASVLRMLGD